ncbi:hypothetical protein EI94DRAFT_1708473 [Lactarius quietus]|nr:hypothetical protein EI94DRAFT_1708473 [Lactarius quietus]
MTCHAAEKAPEQAPTTPEPSTPDEDVDMEQDEDMVMDILPALDTGHTEVIQDIADLHTELQHDMVVLYADLVFSQNKMMRLLCAQLNINLSAASLHIPAAPSFYDSTSTAPSTIFNNLTIMSTANSPITGPSTLSDGLTEGQVLPSSRPGVGRTHSS